MLQSVNFYDVHYIRTLLETVESASFRRGATSRLIPIAEAEKVVPYCPSYRSKIGLMVTVTMLLCTLKVLQFEHLA